MDRNKIYKMIDEERDRQDKKFGDRSDLPRFVWSTILTEENGEVAKACLDIVSEKSTLDELQTELIQVAAVAVAWLESFEEKTGN